MKLSIARSSSFFRTVVITIVAFGVVSCHDDISNPQLQKPVYSILGAGDAPPRSSEGRYSWLEMSDSMLWEYVALTDSIAYVGIKAPDKNRGLYRGKLLVTPSGRELALAKLAEMGLQVVEVDSLLPRVVARFATRDAFMRARQSAFIDYIEPSAFIRDDPVAFHKDFGCTLDNPWSTTLGYDGAGDVLPAAFKEMGIDKAWRRSNGAGVKIGLTDTGIDPQQPELVSNFSTGQSQGRLLTLTYATITNPRNYPYYWADDCGHGTRVASVTAAPRNGSSIVGVAWKADMVSVRQDDDVVHLNTGTAAEGIRIAAQNNARIILLAWGSVDFWSTISDEIQYWYYSSLQPLFIGAAGTSGDGGTLGCVAPEGVVFPADLGFVMAVSAVNPQGDELCNSHVGPEVELVAILTDADGYLGGLHAVEATGPIGLGAAPLVTLSGSSAATALIGGIAALVWSRYPHLSRDGVWQHMREHGSLWLSPQGSERIGYGIIDAHAAVGGLTKIYINARPRAGVISKFVATPNGDGPYTYSWYNGGSSQAVYYTMPTDQSVWYSQVTVTDTYENNSLTQFSTLGIAPSPTLALTGPSSISVKASYNFTAVHTGYYPSVLFSWEEKVCISCAWVMLSTTSSPTYSKVLTRNCTAGYSQYSIRVTARDEWGGDKTTSRTTYLCSDA